MDDREHCLTIPHQFKEGSAPASADSTEGTVERFKANETGIALMPHHPIVVGQRVNLTNNDGFFDLYSTDDGRKIATLADSFSASVVGPAMGSSGELLAATDVHRAVVFDVESQAVIQTFTDEAANFRAIYLGSDEKELLLGVAGSAGPNSFNFQRYDLRSGRCVGSYDGPYRLLSPDRTIGAVISSADQGNCSLTFKRLADDADVGSYRYANKKPFSDYEATLLALSPDNNTVAAYNVDFFGEHLYPTFDIANFSDSRQTATINNELQPFCVQFNDDGRYLVVGSDESQASSDTSAINVYDVARGERVRQLIVPQIPIFGVDIEGARLAASWQDDDGNGVIQVWNNFKPVD